MDNPYEAPSSDSLSAGPSSGEVDLEVIRMLAGTKGWVRFLAVLGFIWTIFLVIGAIGMISEAEKMTGFSPIGPGILVIIYLSMAIINFVAAFKMNQFAGRIGQLLARPLNVNLVAALESQRGFWRYVGVLAIVFIGFIFLGGILGA